MDVDGVNLPYDGDQEGPEVAWVQRAKGERVDLVLEPDDEPGHWVAHPGDAPPVLVETGDRLLVDVLQPGQRVRFDRVWSRTGDRLVVQADL